MRKLFLYGCLLLGGNLFAQQTNVYTATERFFYEGKALHSQKKFAASNNSLEQFLEQAEKPLSEMVQEAEYLLATNAFELRADGAYYKLRKYVEDYPYTSFHDQSCFMIGTLLFEQRAFKEAVQWFARTDEYNLSPNNQTDFCFRYGYSLLQQKDYRNSKYYFQKLIGQNTRYENAANYYYAYTEYTQKHYAKALDGFLKVQNNPEYEGFVPYYIVQIYYAQKKYDELVPLAENLIKKNPKNENNLELYRILGECHYRQKNYPKAIEYLARYQQQAPKVVRNEMYLLGIAYYHTGEYGKAVASLSKTTSLQDEMTQNAYLHLGMCYLKLNDKNKARLAFEQASLADFDADVQEEALYNYAIATYELSYSPFNESVKAFEKFLEKYPNSKHTDKVYDYLVNVYLTTSNYDAAYESMQRIKNPSPRILEAKQRVLCNMGIDAFTAKKYNEAIEKFTESLEYAKYNAKTAAQARYWRADCYYRLGNHEACRNDYNAFLASPGARQTKEFNLAYYNLGYSYFNEKKYDEARAAFINFKNIESNTKSAIYTDALNRIGDCYFTNREFSSAQKYYTEAATTNAAGADYSLFQQGFVKGLQKDYNGKISTLRTLIAKYPKSEYCDDALYEIGHSYMMLEDYEKSAATYGTLAEEYPTSDIARKGLLQKGMLLYNQNRYDEAIVTYKKVAALYPNSEEAATAIESLEKCYVQTNNIEGYTAYIKQIGKKGTLTVEREDSLHYAVAERQYLYGNFTEAARNYEVYLKKFPQGKYVINSRVALADCYYTTGQKEKARDAYIELLHTPTSYNELATSRTAEILYDEKNYAQALEYFKKLEPIANDYQNTAAARLGILRCSAFLEDHFGVISIADKMMLDNRLDVETMREVRYRRAKAYIASDKTDKAVDDLNALLIDTRHAYGAESNYLLAEYYFQNGNSDKAEEIIFDFIDKNTPHQYWLAKSFVLLADIYIQRGDNFQAKQYLLSLKENYTQADDIQEMIGARLAKIEMKEQEQIIFDVEKEDFPSENNEPDEL